MWLGILGKRARETGLTFLWFLCPGTAFSLARQLAGALVSLWRHVLSTGVFAAYVLHVSAVDGGRKGMSEGQCKPRGGSVQAKGRAEGVVAQPAAGAPARALLVLWPRAKPLGSLTPTHLLEPRTLAAVGQTAT